MYSGDGTEIAATPIALSVVIPAYNESKRIERTLAGATNYLDSLGTEYEILVVDDGSPDDTASVIAAWATAHHAENRVRVLRYDTNRGKGYAVRHGVLRSAGALVLFMDADLATPIEEITKLQGAINAAPGETVYAIGSRDIHGGDLLVRQPWYREKLGRVFNGTVQLLATPGVVDTQCGFKLLTRDAGRAVFSRCVLDGFSFDVEAIFVARRLGFRVVEVPVRWAHQEGAAAFTSKAKYLLHGLKMIGELLRIRWAHRGLHPQKSPILNTVAAPPSP
ncbi:MAG: glycosyltransferase family 2 protein [Armatimonadetes bacterium]|nr:glycosyltransferase family 2 protein [Armatimonadota bacterium]